MTKRTSR